MPVAEDQTLAAAMAPGPGAGAAVWAVEVPAVVGLVWAAGVVLGVPRASDGTQGPPGAHGTSVRCRKPVGPGVRP